MSEVCDGIFHCKNGNDEEFCNLKLLSCPIACNCSPKYIMMCTNYNNGTFKLEYFEHRMLLIDNIWSLSFASNYFYSTFRIVKIDSTPLNFAEIIKKFPNAFHIDIRNNSLKNLSLNFNPGQLFPVLQYLSVTFNRKIKLAPSTTFAMFPSLLYLNLSKTSIHLFSHNFFPNNSKLKILDVVSCNLHSLRKTSFRHLKSLILLNITFSSLPPEVISSNLLVEMQKLKIIYSSIFKLCCFAKKIFKHIEKCTPIKSLIHSCTNLLPSSFLKSIVFIFGLYGIIGNVLSIYFHFKSDNKGSKYFYIELSIADMCTGIYFFTLSMVDFYYIGDYIEHDLAWRSSILCSFIGCFSTFSTLVSSFSIVFVTIERYLCIAHPFLKFFTQSRKIILCIGVLFIGVLLSILPIFLYRVKILL